MGQECVAQTRRPTCLPLDHCLSGQHYERILVNLAVDLQSASSSSSFHFKHSDLAFASLLLIVVKGHSDAVCLRSIEGASGTRPNRGSMLVTHSGRLPLRIVLETAVCHFQRCVGRPPPNLFGKTAGQSISTRSQSSFSCFCLTAFCFASV